MRFRLPSFAALAIAVAALGATDDVTTNLLPTAGSVRAQGDGGRPDVIVVLTDQQLVASYVLTRSFAASVSHHCGPVEDNGPQAKRPGTASMLFAGGMLNLKLLGGAS
jgi:hypothetical protein